MMAAFDRNRISNLKDELENERKKTELSGNKNHLTTEQSNKRREVTDQFYNANGRYHYNTELQNQDYEKLKAVYRKVSTNFFILNSTIKDIIYKYPEMAESIDKIIYDEDERLRVGGVNSYSSRLHAFLTEGETVNKSHLNDLTYREFKLPRRYGHVSDIKRDDFFALKKFRK